ncbi:MAG: enoyl-CoA hydratase/isomerase family protein [Polyangiales bacterium]
MEQIRAQQDGSLLRITLARPDKFNAFTGTMREDLLKYLTAAETDPAVRVILITGEGKGFCGGGDVVHMSKIHKTKDVADFSRILDAVNAVARKLHRYPKPTVAAVNGPAAGGGANLALACDIRVGSTSCNFTQSFMKIGLGPDWGGSYVLPRIVGEDRAKELLLTARTVDAQEALGLGLLHQLVEPDQLHNAATKVAQQLADSSPTAVAAAKGAIAGAPDTDLEAALEYERSAQIRCFLSKEAGELFDKFAARAAKKG